MPPKRHGPAPSCTNVGQSKSATSPRGPFSKRGTWKNVVNPIVRAQATALFVFRQKAFMELQAFLEENSATVGKAILERVLATMESGPFQFLYVNLRAGNDLNNMFFIGFQSGIRITSDEPR